MRTLRTWTFAFGIVLCSVMVLATSWVETEVTCPACKTKNKFQDIVAYGSYIYNWPSKFQFIFWPKTDANVVYTCKKCYLSMFMWDFHGLQPDKVVDAKSALNGVLLSGNYESYNHIPMSERLAIAEKIYAKLNKDDDFWCEFYRVLGYHLARENKTMEADAARQKALGLVERMLTDARKRGVRKELLYISGAMRHFLNDDSGAAKDFELGLQTTYSNSSITEEQNKNANANLDRMFREYLDGMKDNKIPKDDGSETNR